MNKWIIIGLIFVKGALADDYSEGRQFALNAQSGALSSMGQINPRELLNDYTTHPKESEIDSSHWKEEGQKAAAKNDITQPIMASKADLEKEAVDFNSDELKQAGHTIDNAEAEVNQNQVPCTNGSCLSNPDEMGDDFGEGVSQLGALSGTADEISTKQIRSGNSLIFQGSNNQCRMAVAGIGNCCGGHARFLNCREEEKAIAHATLNGRAVFVGKYCAHHKKIIGCVEYKQSWCVFPSKLASIIQIQGRANQLGISFGWAARRTNAANCRGITPEELERINFQALDLSSLTQEFTSRATPKKPEQMDTQTTSKIEQMEREGRAHD